MAFEKIPCEENDENEKITEEPNENGTRNTDAKEPTVQPTEEPIKPEEPKEELSEEPEEDLFEEQPTEEPPVTDAQSEEPSFEESFENPFGLSDEEETAEKDGCALESVFGETKPTEKKRGNKGLIVAVCVVSVLLLLSLVCSAFFIGYYIRHNGERHNDPTETASEKTEEPAQTTEETGYSFPTNVSTETPAPTEYSETEWEDPNSDSPDTIVRVAAKCSPSVVTVNIKLSNGSGSGSGVVWSENGYIVTNNHVVEDAISVQVVLANGESYVATVIGTDPDNDLALLRINCGGLRPVTLGDSEKIAVGEVAVAIGNPLGTLANTVTSGIVSALARDISVEGTKLHVMQISAAVNPGNSGGGCFNGKGELIGIVNAKKYASGIEGLAFAIPVNTVKAVIAEMIENDHTVLRKSIGITNCTEINEENYESLKKGSSFLQRVEELNGAPVYGLYIASDGQVQYVPGGETFQSGDIIIASGDTPIRSVEDNNKLLEDLNEGDTITFTVLRLDTVSTGYWNYKYELNQYTVTVRVVMMYR